MDAPPSRERRVGTAVLVVAAAVLVVWVAARDDPADPVVGSWYVTANAAPFPHHMFSFHADGTMSQANPDAGNPAGSDSDGLGVWTRHGTTVVGLFGEVTADRTGTPTGRGEISFAVTVTGDRLTGTAEAHFYDTRGNHLRGPLPTPLDGTRVRP